MSYGYYHYGIQNNTTKLPVKLNIILHLWKTYPVFKVAHTIRSSTFRFSNISNAVCALHKMTSFPSSQNNNKI